MLPVLIAVALGVLLGHLNIFPYFDKVIGKFTTVCLFVMLMSMGAQLGANGKLLAELGHMGWQALVLALGSIVGSLAFVRLCENKITKHLELSRKQTGKKVGEQA